MSGVTQLPQVSQQSACKYNYSHSVGSHYIMFIMHKSFFTQGLIVGSSLGYLFTKAYMYNNYQIIDKKEIHNTRDK